MQVSHTNNATFTTFHRQKALASTTTSHRCSFDAMHSTPSASAAANARRVRATKGAILFVQQHKQHHQRSSQIRKQYEAAGKFMPKTHVQQRLYMLLVGLDVLHQAGIVHADLYPNNVMFAIADKSLPSRIAQMEKERPSPRKVLPDRVIYNSYRFPDAQCVPPPIIADFGEARMGEPGQKFRGRIMPDFYRAPEVILRMEWDFKVDMWSVGLMVCFIDLPSD